MLISLLFLRNKLNFLIWERFFLASRFFEKIIGALDRVKRAIDLKCCPDLTPLAAQVPFMGRDSKSHGMTCRPSFTPVRHFLALV